MDIQEPTKKISISGTHNKYEIKKLINKNIIKEPQKRVVTKKWTFSNEYFDYINQIKLLNNILDKTNIINNENNENIELLNVKNIIIHEINKKIYGYKQQDIIKKKLDINNFITFDSIIEKMVYCELKCRYCNDVMYILYDIKRELKQWSVDRIDNNLGHNIDNYHLACLDCNLKRRCRTDEKFLFTKQLNIIKQDENKNI